MQAVIRIARIRINEASASAAEFMFASQLKSKMEQHSPAMFGMFSLEFRHDILSER
ncbi:unnamed protein product, partial [Larinioides sclopetarius]